MKNELKYAKILESTGLNREQAEIHIKVIEGAMSDNFATKDDIYELKREIATLASNLGSESDRLRTETQNLGVELRAETQKLGAELRAETQKLGAELRAEIQSVRSELKIDIASLTNKIGAMLAAAVAVISGVLTIFKFVL